MRGFIVLIILVAFASPAAAQAPSVATGSWNYAGGAGEVRKMEKSVDIVVDAMNIFIRPIARPRLKVEGKPWKRLEISRTGELVTVTINGATITSQLGKKVMVKGAEDGLTVWRALKGQVLVETYVAKKGGRTNEYHPTAKGMKVVSTIFAPQLPQPLRFSYTYR